VNHRAAKLKHYFLQDINPVVRFLIISDTVFVGATGLLGPIFALFIANFIQGGNEAVAGLAAGIYLFTKSILQIPIAHLVDTIPGEKDDFWLMFVFTVLMSFVPLLYLIIETPLELYLIQFLYGVFAAFTFPTYMAIFTRHIDKEKEGTEWGVYFTLTDLTSATLAALGGYIAVTAGFQTLIFAVVSLAFIGSLLLLPVRPYIRLASQKTHEQ
ncbi:MAG: MFS transporter, partial [Candidatus Niyogibacteria bacterium]|nr:MFS transporter [Candidatus Niyogibacteria bacterium]